MREVPRLLIELEKIVEKRESDGAILNHAPRLQQWRNRMGPSRMVAVNSLLHPPR